MKKFIAAALLAVGAFVSGTPTALAHGGVNWSINLGVPLYYPPAPYYSPTPAYVPPPYYYTRPYPVVRYNYPVYGRPYYRHHYGHPGRGWRHYD